MKVKVCGITQMEQLKALDEMEVEYAGFIFYAPSPRFTDKAGLRGEDVKNADLKLLKVGVFVDASYDEVMRRVDEFGLDLVQLHGRETPYECNRLAANIDVIKAFRFTNDDQVEWTIKDFYAGSDFFLFDTGVTTPKERDVNGTMYGGTGRKFDWNRLSGVNIQKPFFLSGGIEPTDAVTVRTFMEKEEAKNMVAVDINSRFEIVPGVKNLEKVASFITELKKSHEQD